MSNSTETIKGDFVRISSGYNTEITGKLYLNKISINNLAEAAAVVVAAGKHTAISPNSSTITIPANNVLVSDYVFASIQTSANIVNINSVVPSTNQIHVVCSDNPGNSVIAWQALRSTQ